MVPVFVFFVPELPRNERTNPSIWGMDRRSRLPEALFGLWPARRMVVPGVRPRVNAIRASMVLSMRGTRGIVQLPL